MGKFPPWCRPLKHSTKQEEKGEISREGKWVSKPGGVPLCSGKALKVPWTLSGMFLVGVSSWPKKSAKRQTIRKVPKRTKKEGHAQIGLTPPPSMSLRNDNKFWKLLTRKLMNFSGFIVIEFHKESSIFRQFSLKCPTPRPPSKRNVFLMLWFRRLWPSAGPSGFESRKSKISAFKAQMS